jgi:alkaline phosphatase D
VSDLLREPKLGPVVGHVTDASARLWIRGADVDRMRTVGVAGIVAASGKVDPSTVQYFRLHREYDRTGFVDFRKLAAGKPYAAKLGSIAVDSTEPDLNVSDAEIKALLPPASRWAPQLDALDPAAAGASFSTFAAAAAPEISFLFGSCRYPDILPLQKRADRVFGAMAEQAAAKKTDFALMVGDQIYADLFNRAIPIGRADSAREFHERYEEAWSSRNFRRLLQRLPTYMILDDHEIEDNWDQTRIRSERGRALFQLAVMAYRSYQWLPGPRNFGELLYYSFECGGFPFFVTDGRTQRVRREPEGDDEWRLLPDNHLLGYPQKGSHPGQIDRLCAWLVQQQKAVGSRPKFIVTASVFAPNAVEARRRPWKDDAWAAFPQTRAQLLRTIVEREVENVVFLSGDIHVSNVCEIWFEDANGVRSGPNAYSITSSAFYWPFPFADGEPGAYVHDSKREDDGFPFDTSAGPRVMHYAARGFQQEDNFTRVTVRPDRIAIGTFDSKGTALDGGAHSFKL